MAEYKSTTRAQIKKATVEIERDWGGPSVSSEWLILYIRPFELDIQDRGARCVRGAGGLDIQVGCMVGTGEGPACPASGWYCTSAPLS